METDKKWAALFVLADLFRREYVRVDYDAIIRSFSPRRVINLPATFFKFKR